MSDGDATGTRAGRIVSMDQFRGYTVAGMCVVNFLGGLQAIHPVLKHNNNYFSYADYDHAEFPVRLRLLVPAHGAAAAPPVRPGRDVPPVRLAEPGAHPGLA